ncbi:MAG: hypothetical protein WC427_00915 [Candidatus Paceibacterota bacterium]|jgi:hypothetical protein
MNFLKKISFPKSIIIFLSLLVFAGLFFPFFTSAIEIFGVDPFAFIQDYKDNLAQAILGFLFSILMTIPLFVLNVSLDLLTWVAGGNFLAVSFTGSENIIVSTGWGFVRNLANVVLIFGLVIIALSIIVGYQETRAKKTLVNFILIAALINFTPVICGLIIDLAQMIMDLLLKGGVPPTFVNLFSQKISSFNGADLATLFVLTIFAIFASVIYLLFALLFLVRIVMLWVLVILSPIAFASKVLPESKYFLKIFPRICTWDGWWDDFLQWCFLGIPAAGAIFLSNLVMFHIASDSSQIINPPSGNVLNGTFGLLFAYLIPFIVLIVGFFTTLDSGGPMGAKIKGMANKAIGTTKGVLGGAAIGAAVGAGSGMKNQWTTSREGGKDRVTSAAYSAIGGMGGGLKGGLKGGLTQGRSTEGQVNRWKTYVKEKTGIEEEGTYDAELKKQASEINKQLAGLDTDRLREITQKTPLIDRDHKKRAQAYQLLASRGELTDAEARYIVQNKDGLESGGMDMEIIATARPDLAPSLTKKTTCTVINNMSAKNFQEKVQPEALNDFNVVANASYRQIQKTLDDGSPEQANNLRMWATDPAKKRQLLDEITRLEFNLNNYRSGGMPGATMLTDQEAIDTERRLSNLSRSVVTIKNSISPTPP